MGSLRGEAEAIEAFVHGWREHFIGAMRPRYLPPYWSVEARVRNSGPPQEEGA